MKYETYYTDTDEVVWQQTRQVTWIKRPPASGKESFVTIGLTELERIQKDDEEVLEIIRIAMKSGMLN